MFITITQIYECSKCKNRSVEHFSDETHTGIRCKNCGHENKRLHPHLQETSSSGTVSWGSSDEPIRF